MKTTKRIKSQQIATKIEFEATVTELALLETQKRALEAERDEALQAVNLKIDAKLDPIMARIKGHIALAEAYAEHHRAELFPGEAKSVRTSLAIYGFRLGNRTVGLCRGVSVDNAIAALKGIGLGAYVAVKEEIAKAKLLADCRDDRTISGEKLFPADSPLVGVQVPLSDAGLKITQTETFFVEPVSEAAETIRGEAA